MESAHDLFGNYRLIVPTGKRTSERSELIGYFSEKLNQGREKPFSASYIGYRVAHLSVSDLYYMKSVGEDYERRGYPFGKYFWGSLKVKALSPVH